MTMLGSPNVKISGGRFMTMLRSIYDNQEVDLLQVMTMLGGLNKPIGQ